MLHAIVYIARVYYRFVFVEPTETSKWSILRYDEIIELLLVRFCFATNLCLFN